MVKRAKRFGLSIAAAVWFAGAPTHAQDSLETAVKATYLYKFAPFVTWPQRPGPFVICVVGRDPFGPVLDQAVAGQSINGRPVVIARVDMVGRGSSCDIAYIGGSSMQSVQGALDAIHNTSMLTVTDEGRPRGIIDFTVQDGRVRFRIDQARAQANGLTISSKLLNLARIVHGE